MASTTSSRKRQSPLQGFTKSERKASSTCGTRLSPSEKWARQSAPVSWVSPCTLIESTTLLARLSSAILEATMGKDRLWWRVSNRGVEANEQERLRKREGGIGTGGRQPVHLRDARYLFI